MKRIFSITALLIAAILLFMAVYYLNEAVPAKFPAHTIINDIDVSELSLEDAEKKLSEDRSSREFTFDYKGDDYKVSTDSLTFDFSLKPIINETGIIEQVRSLLGIDKTYTVQMQPEESEEFLGDIEELPFCDNKGKEKTTDAYVDLSDFEFKVVKEKIGTEIDPENIRNIAYEKIKDGVFEAELTDAEIVRQPEITADSEEIKERLKYCKDNLSFRVEFDFDGASEVLTPELIDSMASYAGDKPKLRDKKIESYITSLASKYNEYNKTYNFKTHGGSKIAVTGVTFGKVLDKSSMTEVLKKALKAQKDEMIQANWAQNKYSGGEGIGNSYVEVSIGAQHVWCYKNGEVVVECDCVTGAPGHDTARGVFVIQYVTGPTVLRGENGDGTNYESPVNCFMPFYGGQGFHGSNGWRSQWGGSIYKTAGSHGCVNCPDNAAKKMSQIVGYGYPVVIY